MKINTNLLLDHINIVSIGGLINEAVFGNRLSFAVADESTTVVVISSKGISGVDNDKIGVYELCWFRKAVQYSRDIVFANAPDIDMSIVGNKMIFKNGRRSLKFFLCDPKLISTSVANVSEVMEKVTVGEPNTIVLQPAVISNCLRAVRLAFSDKCVFTFDTGNAQLVVGRDNEHQIEEGLGPFTGKGAFKTIVKADFLSKVLGLLPSDKDVTVELRDGMPLLFRFEDYIIILLTVEERKDV